MWPFSKRKPQGAVAEAAGAALETNARPALIADVAVHAIVNRLNGIEAAMEGILRAAGEIKLEANRLSEAVQDVDTTDRLLKTIETFAAQVGLKLAKKPQARKAVVRKRVKR